MLASVLARMSAGRGTVWRLEEVEGIWAVAKEPGFGERGVEA
jgi:hypothetical protein